jgi:hypothetical protein
MLVIQSVCDTSLAPLCNFKGEGIMQWIQLLYMILTHRFSHQKMGVFIQGFTC